MKEQLIVLVTVVLLGGGVLRAAKSNRLDIELVAAAKELRTFDLPPKNRSRFGDRICHIFGRNRHGEESSYAGADHQQAA